MMRLRWLLSSLHAPAGAASQPSHGAPEVPAPHAFRGSDQPAADVSRPVNQPEEHSASSLRVRFEPKEHRTIRIWVAGLCFGQCLCGHTWDVFDGEDCFCPMQALDVEHLAERIALTLQQSEERRRRRYRGTLDAALLARLTSGVAH